MFSQHRDEYYTTLNWTVKEWTPEMCLQVKHLRLNSTYSCDMAGFTFSPAHNTNLLQTHTNFSSSFSSHTAHWIASLICGNLWISFFRRLLYWRINKWIKHDGINPYRKHSPCTLHPGSQGWPPYRCNRPDRRDPGSHSQRRSGTSYACSRRWTDSP